MSTPTPPYRAAILLFPGADILDFAGPAEILNNTTTNADPTGPRAFTATTFSATNPVSSESGTLTLVPAISLAEARENLASYDILIVPGGGPEIMLALAKTGTEELGVIREFARLAEEKKSEGKKRFLLSVCTGAFLLAAAGVLGGKRATTHFLGLEGLEMLCAQASTEAGGKGTEVVRKRWVENEGEGLVTITAGGVSCGLDATLHVVERLVGRKAAEWVAELEEYAWREEV
ncbi:DJ-1 PfpI family protein [Mytilinidion resinicola]|uniref:DJ-1 PfpI family protein n=1 Tax=Mytilinidion resinicola TaxID=574789 RepID=A0A6A6YEP1_9PEZI|nr:DJ-1 PfpI family protein [Mytilinidion resinicola]KAF2807296.1 DJ-1 PfpI family protein [Mytilinidion resinicola]